MKQVKVLILIIFIIFVFSSCGREVYVINKPSNVADVVYPAKSQEDTKLKEVLPNSIISEVTESQVQLKGKEDMQKALVGVESALREIISSGAGDSEIAQMKAIISMLEPKYYKENISAYAKGIQSLLTELLDFKEAEGEREKLEINYSNYIELETDELKINLNIQECFLVAAAIYERSRMTDGEIVLTFAGNYEEDYNNAKVFFKNDDLTIVNNINMNFPFQSGVDAVNYSCFNIPYDLNIKEETGSDANLEDSEIEYFGGETPLVHDIKGVETVVLGYSIMSKQSSETMKSKIIGDIGKYKKVNNIVIVDVYWGDSNNASKYQVVYAREFVDAGADTVMCSNLNLTYGVEKYKDKFIIHSSKVIGNVNLESDKPRLNYGLFFRLRVDVLSKAMLLEIVPYHYEKISFIEIEKNVWESAEYLFGRAKENLEYGSGEYKIFGKS